MHPIEVGTVKTKNNIFLAPMAGVSELTFRKICSRMGAGMVFTELVTARGIRYQKNFERNYRYLEISGEEKPVAIQLFGSDPEDFKAAVSMILEHPVLSGCSMIDINMGCPVPKVIKTGAGCALMKNLTLASQIIEITVKTSFVPVSVKFRKGWRKDSVNAVEFARMCEESGASMITIHGRTAEQMYSEQADWDIISEVKRGVKIPVIGNGDVNSAQSARQMLEQTKADGVMIGRAALGNPWIFGEIICGLDCEKQDENIWQKPSLDQRIEIMKEHMTEFIQRVGEEKAIREMRKHFAWYLKDIPKSRGIKKMIMSCTNEKEVLQVLSFLRKEIDK